MTPKVKHYIFIILGWIFLILGVAGLFLPILQGILFILIGLYLLSRETKWASNLLNRLRTKYPKFSQTLDETKLKARNLKNKIIKRKKNS